MDMENYKIIKHKETGHYHIFHLHDATLAPLSICGHMKESQADEESIGPIPNYDESLIRKIAYEKGRSFCGICISHFYASESK